MRIVETKPDTVLYFGCLKTPGHFTWHPTGNRAGKYWGDWLRQFDGILHTESHTNWLRHVFEAADASRMTFITRKDNTLDTRPGSWSGFLVPGEHTLENALAEAQKAWPSHRLWKS